MATFNLDGGAGDTINDALYPTPNADTTLNIKYGTTVNGLAGGGGNPSIGSTFTPGNGYNLTIRPYGDPADGPARIYTRIGFTCTGTAGSTPTLDVADVTIEQNITGTMDSAWDSGAVALKVTGGGTQLAACLIALRCVIINFYQACKPGGSNSSISYCTLTDQTKGYIAVSGEVADGGSPENGYVGHNVCTSTRLNVSGTADPDSGAGDGISIHDGKTNEHGAGWVIEYNDVDMAFKRENAYDLQPWFYGAIFRGNIARRTAQYGFTCGNASGGGAPTQPAGAWTVYVGNVAIGCRGGYNIEQDVLFYANFALEIDYTFGSTVRINDAITAWIVGNYLEADNNSSFSSRGVITVANAGGLSVVYLHNNVLAHVGTSGIPLFHSVSPSFLLAASSYNRLATLVNSGHVGRRGNGGTMLNLASWQALGHDVSGSAQITTQGGFDALKLNGYKLGAMSSPLAEFGVFIPLCLEDARERRRFSPPSIGPWEYIPGRAPGLLRRGG